jgi:hypothetical protein
MHCEVLNGGLHQYLTNSMGDSGEDVKKHLAKIGARHTRKIFTLLSAIFPRNVIPLDRDQRTDLLDQWEGTHPKDDRIDQLTTRYYAAPDDLDSLILAYARKYPADFAEPSDDIVTRLKRKEPITVHYCGTAEPEWLETAEQSLAALEQFALAQPADNWRDEQYGPAFKKLVDSGEKKKAIRMYKALYMCCLLEAKTGLEILVQRQTK